MCRIGIQLNNYTAVKASADSSTQERVNLKMTDESDEKVRRDIKRNGYGEQEWPDGSYYAGEFLNGNMHGQG